MVIASPGIRSSNQRTSSCSSSCSSEAPSDGTQDFGTSPFKWYLQYSNLDTEVPDSKFVTPSFNPPEQASELSMAAMTPPPREPKTMTKHLATLFGALHCAVQSTVDRVVVAEHLAA